MAYSGLLARSLRPDRIPCVAAMSKTPIFDAVLADSEPDLFLASTIFPRPVPESLKQALARIGHPRFARGGLIPKTEWGVNYRSVTAYESEAEARRQLNLAQMDVPAVLVKRPPMGQWKLVVQ